MAEFPALPLWTDAYLGDTTHLTTIEHGAYMLLLMTAWRTSECALPDDDRLLARYTRMSSQQWKRIRPIIMSFFVIEDGRWKQKRLSDEREAVKRHRQLASDKGRAGAAAKALKIKDRHQAGAKSSLTSASAQDKQGTSSLLHTHKEETLDKESSGENADSDQVFWATAKTYLAPESKNPGALIGKWRRDHGMEATANAITRAQLDRPVQRIPFIEGCFRKAKFEADDWSMMP